MMMDTDEELASKVPEVRQQFLTQFAEIISAGAYDDGDLDRIRNDDCYIECFLQHQKLSVEKAVAMVDTSLKFRKDLDLNNLTEKSFPREMHEMGAIYYHSSDKDGNKILYFQVCKTKKDPENQLITKKFVSWWIDKHFLSNMGERIVILFDMSNTGLSNMDIEMVKFQISCFSTYYPVLLKYMLIYDMPWILNTIWKVIKTLLTAEQQKYVLMVKPSEIQQYIPADKLWVHMGGQDTFEYKYIPSDDSGIDLHNGDANIQESSQNVSSGRTGVRKRVTFCNPELSCNVESTYEDQENQMLKHTRGQPEKEDIFIGNLASISPLTSFVFSPVQNEKQYPCILQVTNTLDQQIAFKVRTTSPGHYRVQPSNGLIEPFGVAKTVITLKTGHDLSQVPKDRFLVMVMKVDNTVTAASNLAEHWKKAQKDTESYMEHRLFVKLRSHQNESPVTPEKTTVEEIAKLNMQMEQLIKSQLRVDRRVTCLFIFQIMVAVTFGLFLTVIVVLSLFDIDINPFSNKYTSACTSWRYQ